MRALLILAVLLPLMVTVAWFAARPIIRRRQHLRHLAELEAENARLDALLVKEQLDRFGPTTLGREWHEHYGERTDDPR